VVCVAEGEGTPRGEEGLFRYAPQAFLPAQQPGKTFLTKEKPTPDIRISNNPMVGKQQLSGILSQPPPAKHNSIIRTRKTSPLQTHLQIGINFRGYQAQQETGMVIEQGQRMTAPGANLEMPLEIHLPEFVGGIVLETFDGKTDKFLLQRHR
jgi:hypothetical protein